jgi:ubiquinone/menaquinone biosynthesis C-methylase UbiE
VSQAEFEPRRFRSTVPFYARYRLHYPPELIARVIALAGLAPGDGVLDLGCGPGLLAVPFAEAGMRVTGIDPEPDMLEAAREAAREARVAIDFRQASSFDLPADLAPLHLVAMGRSFHWMDRAEMLKVFDRLLPSDGAIALFEDEHPPTAENMWLRKLAEVGKNYGMQDSGHTAAVVKGEYRWHVSYLFESVFTHIEKVGNFVRRPITADDIVGRAFSLSMLSRERLGEKAADFERDLRAALAALSPEGRFTEIAELAAIVAKRP